MKCNTADLRQTTYLRRSRSARGLARLLVPVTFVLLASSAWTDPVIGAHLAEGLETMRPTVAHYITDTPLEKLLGPAFGKDVVQSAGALDDLT